MKIKKLFAILVTAASIGVSHQAMAWGGSSWTDSIGTRHYNFGGQSGTSWTDSIGTRHYNFGGQSGTSWTDSIGTTHYSGSLFRGQPAPMNCGDFRGWSAWTPSGSNTTFFSNGSGQSGSAWTPSGSNTTFFNFGGQTGSAWTPSGSTTTFFSGDLFRGQPVPMNCGDFRGWTSTPNVFGGYNYSNGSQSITSTPNVFGGYNYSGSNGMSGQSTPNVFGGFDYSGNLFRGQPAPVNCGDFRGGTSTPNVFGGYNYSNGSQAITSMPNVFGGYNYSGSNGMSGSSMPNVFGGYNYSGNLFRGQMVSSVFANEIFKGKIDEEAISTAIQMRNVDALLSSAWDLKGFETISNAKDEKLNSAMLFDLAAQFAVAQNNADALKAVIALAPECKKYEEQLAMKAQTRGTSKSLCKTAFPELVYLQPFNWADELKNELKDWQQPVADIYLCGMFRGLSESAAIYIGNLINNGRVDMNPMMLATGAMELSCYDYAKAFSPWFEPADVFAEAVEMAIAINDKTALEEMAGMYEKANFKDSVFATYIADQIAMLANTRGMKAPEDHPGTFNMSDIRKLLNVQF